MDLEEGLLEHVLGHLGITQVIPQIAVQLLFVSVDQLLECRPVSAVAVFQEQFFVRPCGPTGQARQSATASVQLWRSFLLRIREREGSCRGRKEALMSEPTRSAGRCSPYSIRFRQRMHAKYWIGDGPPAGAT